MRKQALPCDLRFFVSRKVTKGPLSMSRDGEQRPAPSNEICSSPSRFESRRERRDLIELQWFRVWASNYAPEGLSQQLQIIARPSLANESAAFDCKQPHVVISITN